MGICTTGGCGTAYIIHVDSEQFKGKRIIQQHKLVNEVSEYYILHQIHVTCSRGALADDITIFLCV